MASPVKISCTKDTWVKVATAVRSGNVWISKPLAIYSQSYVATGAAAPPDDMSTACPLPEPGLPISVDAPSDIYVYAHGYDGEVIVAL